MFAVRRLALQCKPRRSVVGIVGLVQPCRYAHVKTPNIDWDPIRSQKDLNKEGGSGAAHNMVLGLLCIAPVVTFFLGVWQVKRLKWKTKLINEAEDRLTYPPTALPKTATVEQINEDYSYRRVYLTGKFDYSREIFVGPRLKESKKGYYLVCPFIQSNGAGEILVERGWISAEKLAQDSRNLQHLSCPKGTITIEAVIKNPPKKGKMQMDHKKGAALFEFVDVPAMAEETHSRPVYAQAIEDFKDHPNWIQGTDNEKEKELESTGKWTESTSWKAWIPWVNRGNAGEKIDETQASSDKVVVYDDAAEFSPLQFMEAGVPIGRNPRIEYRNNHLQYLITWFSLCIASTILLGVVLKKNMWVDPKMEKIKHARRYE